ncbi:MAG: hypothetical protein V7637_4361, partial [Mycobacteriales bacterium]
DGLGHNCGTIAANSGHDVPSVQTSQKPMARGHVYKTCASATDAFNLHFTNVCTAYYVFPT